MAGRKPSLPCFCEIPLREIDRFAKKRYGDEVPTIELMEACETDDEKLAVSVVALLKAEDETLEKYLGAQESSNHHILECRQEVLSVLRAGGLKI